MSLIKRLDDPINAASTSLIGAYTFVWGFYVALPFWDVFTSAPVFHPLLSLAPEYFWGLLAILCGLTMFYGAVKNSFTSLQYGTFICFMHWTMLSFTFYFGDWHNTAWITYGFIATLCAFMYLNIRLNKNNLHDNKT